MQRLTIKPVVDFASLARRWQALEARADGGFFRSWTHLGCLAEERFAHANLLAITQDNADVALALLGTGRHRTWLNQTGDAGQDGVFIEHNGLLVARGAAPDLRAALRAARGSGRLVLSGIDDATLHAARQAGQLHLDQSRWAPAVRLDTLDRPYLETLSANARAQIRRSLRLYGPDLALTPAASVTQAQGFFADMVVLHQESWRRRAQPGAFAEPQMRRFHETLIDRAWPNGEADLLRITAGGRHIGTLYNLIRNGVVASYQSGFAAASDRRLKPGLVCHTLAIQHYADAGARVYDLLGGAERYKLTLAQAGQMLHWATLHRPWSAEGWVRRMASAAGNLVRRQAA